MKRASALSLSILLCGHSIAQSVERGEPDCDSEAIAKTREGEKRGEPASIYLLARYYSTGKCIAGDEKMATTLYYQAAKLNYPPAYYNLGVLAAGGEGDYEKAEQMFTRGAQLGHRGSELHLGILYQLSTPPVRDYAKSYAWLSVTGRRNEPISQEAKSICNDLDKRISEEERQNGKKLAELLWNQFGSVPPFTY